MSRCVYWVIRVTRARGGSPLTPPRRTRAKLARAIRNNGAGDFHPTCTLNDAGFRTEKDGDTLRAGLKKFKRDTRFDADSQPRKVVSEVASEGVSLPEKADFGAFPRTLLPRTVRLKVTASELPVRRLWAAQLENQARSLRKGRAGGFRTSVGTDAPRPFTGPAALPAGPAPARQPGGKPPGPGPARGGRPRQARARPRAADPTGPTARPGTRPRPRP